MTVFILKNISTHKSRKALSTTIRTTVGNVSSFVICFPGGKICEEWRLVWVLESLYRVTEKLAPSSEIFFRNGIPVYRALAWQSLPHQRNVTFPLKIMPSVKSCLLMLSYMPLFPEVHLPNQPRNNI